MLHLDVLGVRLSCGIAQQIRLAAHGALCRSLQVLLRYHAAPAIVQACLIQ
jgi:hypothetical protein